MIGAFMFRVIEAPEELNVVYRVGEYREETVQKLWLITERLNTLHPQNWTDEVTEVIKKFQDHIIAEEDRGYDGHDGHPNQWTFSGSLLYSITVITTIGYGHIAPSTSIGKIVTIAYTIFGIPLCLLYLSNIGDVMATSFKWIYSRVFKCQGRRMGRSKANGDAGAGSTAEIKSVLKRSQSVAYPTTTTQIESRSLSAAEGGQLPSVGGAPAISAGGVSLNLDESGTGSTATSGGAGANVGSASITTRVPVGTGGQDPDMLSISHTSSQYLEEPNTFVGSPERTKKIKINETPINSLDKVTVPISVTMTLMVGYICGGAVLSHSGKIGDFWTDLTSVSSL